MFRDTIKCWLDVNSVFCGGYFSPQGSAPCTLKVEIEIKCMRLELCCLTHNLQDLKCAGSVTVLTLFYEFREFLYTKSNIDRNI